MHGHLSMTQVVDKCENELSGAVSGSYVISNGHGLFPLRLAAAEMARRGELVSFITGGYPTAPVRAVLAATGLRRLASVQRLLRREEPAIPEDAVHGLWLSEAAIHLGHLVRAVGRTPRHAEHMYQAAQRLYGWQASAAVRATGARLYHYRSGYGHASVRVARDRGLVTLCEHSIAHPAVLAYLIENGGRLPARGQSGPISPMWRAIAEDVAQAHHVAVNSDFVKTTFLHQGWDAARVHVIYRGVDDQFMSTLSPEAGDAPTPAPAPAAAPLRVLFAGALDRRKGAESLLAALPKLGDARWRLDIAGVIAPDVGRRFRDVLGDPRVAVRGTLPRTELASLMTDADVFVFPSLCEGSARVVFEALACGCYVITTENAGSIVEDGVHGTLVPPADPDALAAALRRALDDRAGLSETGRRNADLIRRCYQQSRYGESLGRLYASLLAERDDAARSDSAAPALPKSPVT